MIERRVERSTNVYEASQRYLESCARRYGCRAMALASDEGLLIAGVGREAEAVGAVASVAAANPQDPRAELFGEGFHAFAVELGGQRVYVGALGDVPEAECASSVVRIFNSRIH